MTSIFIQSCVWRSAGLHPIFPCNVSPVSNEMNMLSLYCFQLSVCQKANCYSLLFVLCFMLLFFSFFFFCNRACNTIPPGSLIIASVESQQKCSLCANSNCYTAASAFAIQCPSFFFLSPLNLSVICFTLMFKHWHHLSKARVRTKLNWHLPKTTMLTFTKSFCWLTLSHSS